MNPYESQKLRDEYLLFHYATDDEILPYQEGPSDALGFAVRTVTETLPQTPVNRALDLGCAVGRSAFELSTFCEGVVAIDFSQAFIDTAQQLQSQHSLDYLRLEEATTTTQLTAHLPAHAIPGRVQFETGDATALRDDLGSFDIVHAANLICRLPEPANLLARLPALVNPGGTLVITTPCTWLGEFTPPENWPIGPTLDWLKQSLTPSFQLHHTRNMPFLIRETARKFQWTVAEASIWTRAAV
ncbi:MAG: putative 4-mercaptohistidine N1-methyltransferase [Verrucomicrobiales bacterium]